MDSDETKFLPTHRAATEPVERKKTENEPFEFGDRTIFQLRNQDFEPNEPPPLSSGGGDEFGTVVLKPGQHDTEPAQAEMPAPQPAVSEDPIVRIEQKLDAALRQLHSLQQRLESLDATIAKVLLR